jgi:hypothetical protein
MSKHPIWIEEKEAAAKMGYKDTKYFRSLVKDGTFSISHRCNPKGRYYEYDVKDIERLKNETATIIYQ